MSSSEAPNRPSSRKIRPSASLASYFSLHTARELSALAESDLNDFDRIELWLFEGKSTACKVLRELQKCTGLSRRIFFYLAVGVFYMMLLSSNSMAAVANFLSIIYPLFLTVKHLMDPEFERGPQIVFWVIYALYTQYALAHPHKFVLALEPALFFYLWCPATQGAKALYTRMFAPLLEMFVQEKFSPDLWVQVFPWLARILYGARMMEWSYLTRRFTPEQIVELKKCLRRAKGSSSDLSSRCGSSTSSTATAILTKTPIETSRRRRRCPKKQSDF
ncbi:hypothetical protein L596_026025 [Steinernema carpocapsae]|uniref:Receptor expression-enhancing protein n=1 Tax=Steinernema carpocapsae TaxID=34508 RepID=A0A4U5M139_STECR|nr:hypothetical protein L596_026025 [Steinernema carpocapsae]